MTFLQHLQLTVHFNKKTWRINTSLSNNHRETEWPLVRLCHFMRTRGFFFSQFSWTGFRPDQCLGGLGSWFLPWQWCEELRRTEQCKRLLNCETRTVWTLVPAWTLIFAVSTSLTHMNLIKRGCLAPGATPEAEHTAKKKKRRRKKEIQSKS